MSSTIVNWCFLSSDGFFAAHVFRPVYLCNYLAYRVLRIYIIHAFILVHGCRLNLHPLLLKVDPSTATSSLFHMTLILRLRLRLVWTWELYPQLFTAASSLKNVFVLRGHDVALPDVGALELLSLVIVIRAAWRQDRIISMLRHRRVTLSEVRCSSVGICVLAHSWSEVGPVAGDHLLRLVMLLHWLVLFRWQNGLSVDLHNNFRWLAFNFVFAVVLESLWPKLVYVLDSELLLDWFLALFKVLDQVVAERLSAHASLSCVAPWALGSIAL